MGLDSITAQMIERRVSIAAAVVSVLTARNNCTVVHTGIIKSTPNPIAYSIDRLTCKRDVGGSAMKCHLWTVG